MMDRTKLPFLILALMMITSAIAMAIVPTGTTTAAQTSDGWQYDLNVDGDEATITGYTGYDNTGLGNTVAIPGSILVGDADIPVTALASNLQFTNKNSIYHIIIPSSVTTIGTSAFSWFTSLRSVTLGSGVAAIGEGAFEVTNIIEFVVNAANPYYSSVEGALCDKAGTTLILCPPGATGPYIIPESIEAIGDGAFEYLRSPSSIVLNDKIIAIGASAFSGLIGLNSITIGASVASIDTSALNIFQLAEIKVDERNMNFSSEEGVLYNHDKTELLKYPNGRTNESFTVPDGVIHIAEGAFQSASWLLFIEMPDSVTTIGDNAFSSCSRLNHMIFGSGINTIGSGAFSSSSRIETIIFHGNAPTVADGYLFSSGGLGAPIAYRHQAATGFPTTSGGTWSGMKTYILELQILEPLNVVVTTSYDAATGLSNATLTWDDPLYIGEPSIDGYKVLMGTTVLATVGSNTATLEGLTIGQTYELTVVGYNDDDGNGRPSDVIEVIPLGVTFTYPSYDGEVNTTGTGYLHWSVLAGDSAISHSKMGIMGEPQYGTTTVTSQNMQSLDDDLTSAPLPDGMYIVVLTVVSNGDSTETVTARFVVETGGPTIKAQSPTSSDLQIGPSSIINITFSEAMDQTSVVIDANGVDGTIAWSGNTATFTPSSPLAYSTYYTVTVSGKDLAGNELTGTNSWSFWTKADTKFTGRVQDNFDRYIAGAVVSLSNGASTTTDANGYFQLGDLTGGEYTLTITKENYDVFTRAVSISTGQTHDLYTLEITASDKVRPIVSSKEPEGTSVPIGSTITITFSEPVDQSTVIISVKKGSTTVEGTGIAWSGNTATVTLPTSPLAYNTTYTVTVSGGRDLIGNVMPTTSWNFKTQLGGAINGTIVDAYGTPTYGANVSLSNGKWFITGVDGRFKIENLDAGTYSMTVIKGGHIPMAQSGIVVALGANNSRGMLTMVAIPDETIAPTIAVMSPSGSDEGSVAFVVVTFSEAMNHDSVMLRLNGIGIEVSSWSGNTATSKMLFLLASNSYTVTVGGEDLAGNSLSGATSWTFSTWNFLVQEVALGGTVVDEAGNPMPGVLVTAREDHSSTVYSTLTDGTGYFSFHGAPAFRYPADQYDSYYTVTASKPGYEAVSKRLSAPPGSGVGYGSLVLVALVPDTDAPTIITKSPTNTNEAVTSNIVVTFNEVMDQSSVTIAVTGGVIGSISWSTDGKTATFNPSANMAYNAQYTVTVNGKDLSGNELTTASWAFTTLKNEGRIYGTITNSAGSPIAGAAVTLSNGMTGTTSSTGYYEFYPVASGIYTITIAKSGYATNTYYPLAGVAGSYTIYSVQLEAAVVGPPESNTGFGSITGIVKDNDGNPIAGATVRLNSTVSALTNGTGHFVFENAIFNTYTLTIEKGGYEAMTRSVTVDAEGQEDIGILSLEAEEVDHGHAAGEDDAPGNDPWIYLVIVAVIAIAAVGGFTFLRKKK